MVQLLAVSGFFYSFYTWLDLILQFGGNFEEALKDVVPEFADRRRPATFPGVSTLLSSNYNSSKMDRIEGVESAGWMGSGCSRAKLGKVDGPVEGSNGIWRCRGMLLRSTKPIRGDTHRRGRRINADTEQERWEKWSCEAVLRDSTIV
ncbi:unnamed protein product [Protopolystoma xenopodis]|uniref:Uncharacterized protein n=1 Tax=Protopolystoma xenopodis TaxID=117903 RepID=A0A448XM74_9PLAT|nr:unnamed protein product [Protopolystoma xenopodis]